MAFVFLLIAIVIWGGAYVVTKAGLDAVPPMWLALLRYVVASVLLVPLALARGGLARLPRPIPWRTLVLMALSGVGLYYVLFNLGISYTTASQSALIQSSIPVVTAIMAVLWLGERLSAQRVAGIVLAVAGVALIVARTPASGTGSNPALGNALTIASVFSWGVYTMFAKRIANADPLAVTTLVSVIGTVMLIPAALVETTDISLASISTKGWLAVAFLGVFPSAVAYLLFNRALRDIDASVVGTLMNLTPVIGVLSGVIVLGETVTTTAIAGGVIVLAGVFVSMRR